MSPSDPFSYLDSEFIESMHRQFQENPQSVDISWLHFFQGMKFGAYKKTDRSIGDSRIFHLIEGYRRFGHLYAQFNPLITSNEKFPLVSLGFSENELDQDFPTCGLLKESTASVKKICSLLEETYCEKIGIEYLSGRYPEMERWLQDQIESNHFRSQFSIEDKRQILTHLNKSELFEIFLHTKYVGQKRFSLEGGETLIPVLFEIIEKSAEIGADEFVIGMAHRGRLNVLCNILAKSYSMVFGEFEDYLDPDMIETAGDVKYHKGYCSNIKTRFGKQVHISLAANPSHLESVNPIVEGKVKAKQIQHNDEAQEKIIPILIHGDSSLAGQGVIYETMQLHNIAGYSTGGTVHLVINNQIGFTTLPKEYRSARYSTDIAHAFGFPVFHVNAEDPEGCVYAAELALKIRHLFHIDVFIEINGYRKYGHNESDEPMFTQPIEYQCIKKKKSIREIYRDELIHQGILEKKMAFELEEAFKKALHFELEELKIRKTAPVQEAFGGVWEKYHKATQKELFEPIHTAVDLSLIQKVGLKLVEIPEQFEIHKKLMRLVNTRKEMILGNIALDWSTCEQLAFATLLWEGSAVRFSGQDSQRGTFTQRHSVWVDQKTDRRYFPLSHLKQDQGLFSIYNSSLSEFAVLGFEFGYSLSYPSALVIWEAQFGDFANGAQVIFDQYLASSEQKWRRYSGLVVLLPHGYEGQGAEHSSGRIERFLQLAAESNMQIVNPTTPAQYFHLLRRQVKREIRIPLIIFTPKGLLRHPKCVNDIEALSTGTFQAIIDDPSEPKEAARMILCCGRIYYDLLAEREKKEKQHQVVLIRIEQLYPLDKRELNELVKKYENVKEYCWVQEEPRNMGAFHYMYPILQKLLPKEAPLQYIGRSKSAVTATGLHKKHEQEHHQLMNMAFDL